MGKNKSKKDIENEITSGVNRVVEEYCETLKLLGGEKVGTVTHHKTNKDVKDLKITCNCVGECSVLKVIDYDEKSCEIQISGGDGAVYLEEKSIKKLIKYLEKIINIK